MSIELGKEKIQLRFNFIARLKSTSSLTKARVLDAVGNLPQLGNGRGNDELSPFYGFLGAEFASYEPKSDYERNILSKTIPIGFQWRKHGRTGYSEIHNALIFWLFPDVIVFCGARDITDRAGEYLRFLMSKSGIGIDFMNPDFEWFYLLKIFEIVQERNEWKNSTNPATRDPTSAPSNEIAEGVNIVSLHDLSSEWEKESSQAKKVIAKEAGDLTQDLSTVFSILTGRFPKTLLASVTMENKATFVRISKGGRLFIERAQSGEEKKESELERIIWGLELTRRLLDAYEKWKLLPLDEMLPSPRVYTRADKEVRRNIEPLLDNALKERLSDLRELRKKLKSQRED